ncbi:MAG: hypothetical protein AB7G08_00925 [Hyphomicrobiaceae bacterium]
MLMILVGFAILGFGLFIFYAWLPVFYALFGFEIGLLLGGWMFGSAGSARIAVGIALGAVLAAATYLIEPYRRLVVGYLGGSVVSLSLASLIGLGRFDSALLAAVIAVIGGVAGAMIAMRFFDALVIAASAYGGATLIVLGARMLLPIASEPTALSAIPAIIAIVLAILGMRFQLQHMDEWRPAQFSGRHHAAEAEGRKK